MVSDCPNTSLDRRISLNHLKNRKKLAHTVVYVYIKDIIREQWEDRKMETTPRTEKLVRKQFLISPSQVEKLNRLARDEGTSVAQILHQAIDTYNPDMATIGDLDASELMELVSERLKEAITSTQKANRAVSNALKKLSTRSIWEWSAGETF